MIKYFKWIIVCGIIATGCKIRCNKPIENKTICNPLNLSYRFMPEKPSRREAADPSVIIFRDDYYLFASKSGGYWYSADLADWIFVETDEIPTEEYAPTAISLNDTIFFLASSGQPAIYKSGDPQSGKWEIARESLPFPVVDPAFYQDDDGRLYLYWGCSNREPIYAVELDYNNNFEPLGNITECFSGLPEKHGWEQKGDYNELPGRPWIEGAWVNKHNNRYYLQYAGPGTEYKSYADGVYVADNPLGPFKYAEHNPFSYKPEGFICGAGHGSTIKDRYGNYWHFATMSVNI
ncbi:MAG: family 43 glycosylhydrolase, partial [Marinilabiliaceae bacterium]|nr:family 43 glycosylhydrolase [Marinilabiliaceae bacterium]